MTTTATPIYRMPPPERRRHAAQFVSVFAVVVVDRLRGAPPLEGEDPGGWRTELRGRILSVATPLVGTVADVLIVRVRTQAGGLEDFAVSLATVESITPAAT